jgi:hypothetical protein
MQSGFSSFIYFAQTTLSASDLGNSAKSMTSITQNGLMGLIQGKAMPVPACPVACSKQRAQGGVLKAACSKRRAQIGVWDLHRAKPDR